MNRQIITIFFLTLTGLFLAGFAFYIGVFVGNSQPSNNFPNSSSSSPSVNALEHSEGEEYTSDPPRPSIDENCLNIKVLKVEDGVQEDDMKTVHSSITNNCNHTFDFVSFDIVALDENGQILDTGLINAMNFQDGKTLYERNYMDIQSRNVTFRITKR